MYLCMHLILFVNDSLLTSSVFSFCYGSKLHLMTYYLPPGSYDEEKLQYELIVIVMC